MYRIMIVEDDRAIAGSIAKLLERWGLHTRAVDDFQSVLKEFIGFDPQLVLIDISLPFYNGYYWCEEIRKISKVPIIFISSASDNMNIVMAMNMGADDFIAKPFDGAVLTAKIQAMLRRTYDFSGSAPVLAYGDLLLHTGDQKLTYREKTIELTKNEYRILLALMEKKGCVVTREELMEKLWETDSFADENTLTVNINRLRRKLEKEGIRDFIMTKFGVGYFIPRDM